MSTSVESMKRRSCAQHILPKLLLLSVVFFVGSTFVLTDCKQKFPGWASVDTVQNIRAADCEVQCRRSGSETLPKGIVSMTSDLEMRPLWGPSNKKNPKSSRNLLAMSVGLKQKESVNKIVKKFLLSDFSVMLFHYDGNVDDWKELEWSNLAIHVSALSQTKWWFAKRFLHPDIVSEYAYIFLWDEDLGVDNFHAGRYLSIIKEEGLEISQPALDPKNSEVHYHLTARLNGSRVHRRIHYVIGGKRCDENSTSHPCTGFVEMMAPVFSRASWRCAWHMIQTDLVQGWGLDFQLGYCAQGDSTKKIGIVDSEYVVHYGLPTLGGSATKKEEAESTEQNATTTDLHGSKQLAPSPHQLTEREAVKKWSYKELEIFKNRWKKAVNEDHCWIKRYQEQSTKPKKR
ncbi:uncharacterized protein LOC119999634 isoform X2 [Tripterygium wilfordii]|uniref:uncharacterized protein LOC119999634 isoform X2 n=1 Tax=Tripterygium wilfordii TaxID=458696 RepID=UPI0018F8414A|nr:uncharacterized protein LOC119999634 isoform X2 [Tripterygium wilfordii]